MFIHSWGPNVCSSTCSQRPEGGDKPPLPGQMEEAHRVMEYCSALRRTGAWDTRHTGGPGTGSSVDRPGRRDRTGSVPGGQSRGGGRQLVAAGGRARGAAAAECGASLRGDGASGRRWVLSGMRSPKRPLRGGGNPQVGGSAEGVPAGTRRPERATMKEDCGPLAMLSCSARREIRHGPGVIEK